MEKRTLIQAIIIIIIIYEQFNFLSRQPKRLVFMNTTGEKDK